PTGRLVGLVVVHGLVVEPDDGRVELGGAGLVRDRAARLPAADGADDITPLPVEVAQEGAARDAACVTLAGDLQEVSEGRGFVPTLWWAGRLNVSPVGNSLTTLSSSQFSQKCCLTRPSSSANASANTFASDLVIVYLL
ncbi:hypothetical protein, partial [Streptomyces sp. NBC_00091]|uniref:hypothetical protein n=1 Tax=Streptomyces sp. NBC_00091 TaxID=2975648 RepID=UPI00224CE2A0